MPEPSLSELTNLKVDPELGSGTPAVVIDQSRMVSQLNQTAQFNAEMQWKKYTNFQNNLKEVYKNLGDASDVDVMDKDRPELQKRIGEIFRQIGEHPREFFSGGRGAADLNAKIAKVRSDAIGSKHDRIYDQANRMFLQSNDQSNTPENRAIVEAYPNQTMGKRQPYLLQLAGTLDLPALAKTLNESSKTVTPVTKFTGGPKGNQFIESGTQTSYSPEKYKAIGDVMYDVPGPLKNTIDQRFAQLPKAEQEKYGSAKEWIGHELEALRLQDSYSKESVRDNPFELETMREKGRFMLEAFKAGKAQDLAILKEQLKNQTTPQKAHFLLDTYAEVMGNITGKKAEVTPIKGGKKESEDMVNIDNDILKKYAEGEKASIKEGGSLDETTETIIGGQLPELKTITKNGDLRLTFYQHYTKNDTLPAGKQIGDIVTDKDGENIIKTSQVIPKRRLLANLAKDVIEKKEMAYTIDAVDDFLEKHHKGNITNYIKSEKSAKKKYKVGGKTFTQSQLEQGAKKYNMTLPEYQASIGAQDDDN